MVLASGLSGCVDSLMGSTITESYESFHHTEPGAHLEVVNVNGTVQVDRRSGDDLRISGEKRAASRDGLAAISISVTTGDRVVVEVDLGDRAGFDRRGVDLEVAVPDSMIVDRVSTQNGSITINDVSGDVSAATSNGSITVEGVDGYVSGETSNGSITIRDTTGIDGTSSSNGSLELDIRSIREDTTCRTSNGDIVARAGPDLAVGIDLQTSLGSVSVDDLPYSAEVESRSRITAGSLRGGTDPVLFLRTSNGDITLEPIP